jgi:hypothetical protein
MTVSNGTEAQVGFMELIDPGTAPERRAQLRQAMIEYCRKDTAAMVGLVEWLWGAAKETKTNAV